MSGVVSVGVAIGAAAIAADTIATVGFTAMAAFEVVGAVGAAIGAVGVLTHTKELMIAGTVLGVAGGVGALADSAGMFAGDIAASATGTGMGGGEMAQQVAATQAAASTPGALNPDVVAPTAGLVNSATPAGVAPAGPPPDAATMMPMGGGSAPPEASGPATNVVDNIAGQVTGTPTEASTTDTTPTVTAGGPTTDVGTGGTPYTGPQGDAGVGNSPSDATRAAQQPGAPGGPAAAPDPNFPGNPPISQGPYTAKAPIPGTAEGTLSGTPASVQNVEPGAGIWGKIMNYIGDKPGLALGILSAGGQFLSGALNPLTPAQVQALQARAKLEGSQGSLADAQSALLSRQLANMGGSMPIATRTGLINR